jgi:predicted lipoprotein with Yx(FWY)xxD motif
MIVSSHLKRMALAMVGLSLTACGSPAPSSTATPSPSGSAVATSPTAASMTPSPAAELATAESRYGRILVDGSGRTLYLFDIESDPTPKCYGACAVNWPPMVATAASTSDPLLNQTLIAVSRRDNDSKQLTYNGHPLYYYVGDHITGEIKCQAVIEFGGGWYVVDSRGNKITTR